jgi:hypothetical protein
MTKTIAIDQIAPPLRYIINCMSEICGNVEAVAHNSSASTVIVNCNNEQFSIHYYHTYKRIELRRVLMHAYPIWCDIKNDMLHDHDTVIDKVSKFLFSF